MKQEIMDLIDEERAHQVALWGGKEHDIQYNAGTWAHFVNKQSYDLFEVDNTEDFKSVATKIAALGVAMLELVVED